MTASDRNATEALRLSLLHNGFTPLPNAAKQCRLSGWPRLIVNEAMIHKWTRIRNFPDTGIRLDGGLCAIDIDINDPVVVALIVERLGGLLPGSLSLVRHGNGAKIAVFVRTSQLFGRICTHRWIKPGDTEDDGAHCVEIFGGGAPRQFGAFGRCGPNKDYRWPERSPIDRCFNQLPVFARPDFCRVADIADNMLREMGWRQILLSKCGESASRPVRDLVDDMLFECSDGMTRTLADLEALANCDGLDGLRCSASWLEGPSASRTDRCLIGRTKRGELVIYETASAVTHMPKSVETNINEIKAKLARMREIYRV